jgi:hypothetical protein
VTKTETADSEQFMYTGKAFLSLLASVEGEYLDFIQTKLLPHELSFEDPMPYRYSIHADSGVDLRPCSNPLDTRSLRPRLGNVADEQFVPDHRASSSPATCYSAYEESNLSKYQAHMRDQMAISGLQAEDEEGTNSLLSSRQRRLGSLSPSLLSSNWGESPVTKTRFSIPEDTTKTHWLHCYDQLNYLYGGPYEDLCYIIRIGDSFLREDARDFITQFYRRWNLEDPWSRLPISNPTLKRPLTERMLKSLHCAEAIEFDSIVDPVKLRIARMLLHHYFKQLCMNFKKSRKLCNLSPGKGVASVAKDIVLETIYNCRQRTLTPKIRKKHENSFKWHLRIGKRWSYVASHLGVGITLTCSPSLEAHM